MKKFLLIATILMSATITYAMDINVDSVTDVSYANFIKSLPYFHPGTLKAVNSYEKIRLKAKQAMEQVTLNFDGRFYLYPDTTSLDYNIDSAYVTIANGPFVVYAGKQRIKWGTGYFWNPSDNLQPAKNLFRTTEDLEGVFALRAEYSSDIVTSSLIILPTGAFGYGGIYGSFDGAVQLYKMIGTCDVYANYIYKPGAQSFGAAISWDAGFAVVNAEYDMKQVEAGTHYVFGDRDYSDSYSIGLSKMISDELSAVIEFYRNNNGSGNDTFETQIRTLGFAHGLSKVDYLAYTVNYVLDQKFGFGITGLHGLDDGTTLIFPSVSYVENQNYDIQLALLENLTRVGINEGTYSFNIYNTVELRINAYF